MSKIAPIKYAVKFLVWAVRGSPLMIQLIIVFYGPGLVADWASGLVMAGNTNAIIQWLSTWAVMDRFVAVIVAFSLNYACYFSEIYRGGIQGVPVGQEEAGLVLGMTKGQIFVKVKLLQMIKRIIPPMSNEIITLVKDTSLSRIIALQEIIWAGQAFMKGSQGISGVIWPLFFTAIYYLVFNGILTVLFGKLEKKLEYFR
jgi:polar amino acid transport system permease protein